MAEGGIIGKKIGMTQIFREDGQRIPVTVIEADNCLVVQKRTMERDGYSAIQIGMGEIKDAKLTQPMKGHFAKTGVKPRRFLREIRVNDESAFEVGQAIGVDLFAEGQYVDVAGTSKGKGFQGVIKRHGFRRGPSSHGSHFHRGPGGFGGAATPGRVFKGRRLPGRMGGKRISARGLQVAAVDQERNLLLIKGSVPGPRGAIVLVRPTNVGRKQA